jgi:hypothetical protein
VKLSELSECVNETADASHSAPSTFAERLVTVGSVDDSLHEDMPPMVSARASVSTMFRMVIEIFSE